MTARDLALDYKKLLDFICQCEEIEDIKDLFELLDNFWQSEFKSSPLLVYSVKKHREPINDRKLRSHCRGFWNKDKETLFFSKEEVNFFLDHVYHDSELESSWKRYQMLNSNFYIFSCGSNEKQDFFGIFKIEEEVNPAVIGYLNQFLSSTFVKLSKFSEVSKLKDLVHIDDVTGLFNQRKFIKDIDEFIEKYKKFGEIFSVIFLDIDHFKQVNDGHGHLVGTQLLSDVGKILGQVLRDEDLSYRYGGDEFVVVVPRTGRLSAIKIGERILLAITAKEFVVDEEQGLQGAQKFKLSVSAGVATFPDDASSRTEIIAMADKMMYVAKKSGRGKVCHTGIIFAKEDDS